MVKFCMMDFFAKEVYRLSNMTKLKMAIVKLFFVQEMQIRGSQYVRMWGVVTFGTMNCMTTTTLTSTTQIRTDEVTHTCGQ